MRMMTPNCGVNGVNLIVSIKITLSILLIITYVPITVLSVLSSNSEEKIAFTDNNKLFSERQHENELTESMNIERQELLQKVCDEIGHNKTFERLNEEQLDHLLVDKGHKLLYCYVPKVSLFFSFLCYMHPNRMLSHS